METKQTSNERGIITNRKCTDVFCAILFISTLLLMAAISIWGYSKGNLKNIAPPFDSESKKCGQGSQSDFPYLYVNDPAKIISNSYTVCIKKCPKSENDVVECVPNKFITDCKNLQIYPSTVFIGRICIPTAKEMMSKVKAKVNVGYFKESIEEFELAWPVYIITIFIVFFIAVVYYFFLQYCSGCMLWTMILGVILGFAGFGVFAWFEYKKIDQDKMNNNSGEKFKNLAIISWVFSGVAFLLVLCLCSQINLALKMIKAAARFINDRKTVFLVPVIHSFLIGCFIVYWIISFLFIFSVGEIRHDKGDYFGDMIWDTTTEAFVWIFLFSGIWCVSFSFSSNIFVISSLAASWYFDLNRQGISIITGFKWANIFHLGSIAFGSFILAIIWAIQLILYYFYQKAKNVGKDFYCYKCLMCFVACCERLINYVNRHSYIEIVIRNINYCSAVGKSISLFTGNFLRFGAIAGVVGLFLIMGSVLITIIVTIIGYYILEAIGNLQNEQYDTVAPLIVIALISFFITIYFNYVFSVSADTMLHCFMYDEENSSGSKGNSHDEIRRAVNTVQDNNTLMN